jgi:hypothetical protein
MHPLAVFAAKGQGRFLCGTVYHLGSMSGSVEKVKIKHVQVGWPPLP